MIALPDTETAVTHDGLTRRDLLQLLAASGVGAIAGARLHAKAPSTLGVQIYTVRDQFAKDPEGTIKAIAEIGYKEIELVYGSLEQAAALAKKYGLSPISIHMDSALLIHGPAPNRDDLPTAIAKAQSAGAKYLVVPYVAPPDRPKDAAGFAEFGKKLQAAGDSVTKAGLTFCYHNHAFEFAPLPDGKRPLDLMLEMSDPNVVKLELDVFWTSITGTDPVDTIKRYTGRVALLHLKDKMKGAPTAMNENVPKETFVEVGSGAVDFPAVLAAAQTAKVEHYFVEQDQSTDPIASLRQSYKYLTTLT
jgi:sugar phosphate isomerase/epimerase